MIYLKEMIRSIKILFFVWHCSSSPLTFRERFKMDHCGRCGRFEFNTFLSTSTSRGLELLLTVSFEEFKVEFCLLLSWKSVLGRN